VTPAGTVAERVADWPAQIGLGAAVGLTGAAGAVPTVTVTLEQLALKQAVAVFLARAK